MLSQAMKFAVLLVAFPILISCSSDPEIVVKIETITCVEKLDCGCPSPSSDELNILVDLWSSFQKLLYLNDAYHNIPQCNINTQILKVLEEKASPKW